jgi:hypothetical protein
MGLFWEILKIKIKIETLRKRVSFLPLEEIKRLAKIKELEEKLSKLKKKFENK